MKVVLLLFVSIVLSACSLQPVAEQPAVINELAHSGGSVVAFSRSGNLLASGGWEGGVRLWQLPAGEQIRRWAAHGDSVNGIVFTDDDRHILTAGYDGLLVKWRTTGGVVNKVTTPAPVTHMEASAELDRVVTGHDDGSVRVWRLSDLELLYEHALHRGSVKAVTIDSVRQRYASAGSRGQVFVWKETGEVMEMESPPADAWTLAFAPDGSWLMGGSWFRLYRWNLADAALTTIPTEHHGIIKSIQYLPDDNRLATISRQTDSSVYFMDPETGAVLRRFQKHELCGADVTVSNDGRYLATTSDDASVRIWLLDAVNKE